LKKYNGYLIDLDGTMYRGNEPINPAIDFVNRLAEKNIPYLFVTNNSSVKRETVADKLNRMGIQATRDQVVTTSMATANYIKGMKENARCFVIGEEGLHAAMEEKGLTVTTDEHCDFVVVGIDRQVNYEKFALGCLAVSNGATFISTNSDVAIPTERGLLPGNGSLTSVITVSTGQSPVFVGKPEPVIMNEAMEILGLSKQETLMVGDNYATDIRAGMNAGIDTLMVFTGVTPFADLSKFEHPPTYYVNSLHEWMEQI